MSDNTKIKKYIRSDEFIKQALAHNCDVHAIFEANKDRYFDISTVRQRIKAYRVKGLLPLDSGNKISYGEVLKGSSTLYDDQGNIKLQWVKTDIAKTDQLEAFRLAINALITDVPSPEPVCQPLYTNDNIMTVYTIGDAHIGMMAWGKESGADHDIVIAESDLLSATKLLISQSTPTTECFIVDVGDYFHSDNFEGRTAKSGNALDVDGRYPKVLEIGLRITTELIDLALAKHQIVRWRSAIGKIGCHLK